MGHGMLAAAGLTLLIETSSAKGALTAAKRQTKNARFPAEIQPLLIDEVKNFSDAMSAAFDCSDPGNRLPGVLEGRNMEANVLMQIAVVPLGIAAVASLSNAVMRVNGNPRPPHWLATGYGASAAVGLVLACIAAITVGIPTMAQVALLLFLLAAASDSLLTRLLRRNRLPMPLAVLRAFLAGVAFVLLLISVYAQPYIAHLPVPVMINNS
jgi:hypothetical protein